MDVTPTRRMRVLAATYSKCDADGTQQFVNSLDEASDGCATDTSYDWGGGPNPTDSQREQICKCTVKPFDVPKCYWTKEGKYDVSTDTHFKFTYDCGKTSGKLPPELTEVDVGTTTPLPTPTMTPSTTPLTTTAPKPAAQPVTNAPSSGSLDGQVCTAEQSRTYYALIFTASANCASFDWSGDTSTTPQQVKICECASLVKASSIPNCLFEADDGWRITLPDRLNKLISNCKNKVSSTGSGSRSSNVGVIAGIAAGVLVVVLLIGLIVYKHNRKDTGDEDQAHNDISSPVAYQPLGSTTRIAKRKSNNHAGPRQSNFSDATYTTNSTAHGSVRASGTDSRGGRSTGNNIRYADGGKWDDPAIVAARIPYDTIYFGPLLSRGGFGEVFRGTYRGETVAIKQLLPARRKDLKQIDDFLGEVQLISSLEHERIVQFIGVAWNSLSDACMVVEFMENGDLRSVLTRWNEGTEQRPIGFDTDKVRIALHVAHALTYLHSMQPVVVHRDLKSKNILLDANFDAKLTDFGTSRERAEATMTAGVGSSLWMAPEVMMGERYNEKADVFSFGVVLSELDTHQLPYFHARETENGQRTPETAILQQVMLGRLTVQFTDRADPEIAQLGGECVCLDADSRPTAAHVLHRVHQILQRVKAESDREI